MFGWLFGSKNKAPHARKVHVQLKSNISEPVQAIVKTFDEKGRWKIKMKGGVDLFLHQKSYGEWEVTDTKTGEVYHVLSEYLYYYITRDFQAIVVPRSLYPHSLPTWMTEEEQKYVAAVVNKRMNTVEQRFKAIRDRGVEKSKVQAETNKQKERQRLMGVYCNEK